MSRLTDEKSLWMSYEEDPEEEEDEDEGEEERSGPDDDKLQEKVLKTRTVLVCESISDELARKVYQQLLILEAESNEKPITVLINSPGGEADSGFGIYDMLRFVSMPVRTLVAGLCASAAVSSIWPARTSSASPCRTRASFAPAIFAEFRAGLGSADRLTRDRQTA